MISITSGILAPMIPITTPSTINGARIKKSEAPIRRIMPISARRTVIPVEMVELIKKIDTARRIKIMAIDT